MFVHFLDEIAKVNNLRIFLKQNVKVVRTWNNVEAVIRAAEQRTEHAVDLILMFCQ